MLSPIDPFIAGLFVAQLLEELSNCFFRVLFLKWSIQFHEQWLSAIFITSYLIWKIIIIQRRLLFIENVASLHAKLGSDVYPRVDNLSTSGNTLQ